MYTKKKVTLQNHTFDCSTEFPNTAYQLEAKEGFKLIYDFLNALEMMDDKHAIILSPRDI